MKNKIVFSISILAILCSAVSCKPKKTGIHPTKNDITESVYATGKVKAVNQYTVYATVNGILNQILIKPGDKIKNNQALFEIDNTTAALNAENARLQQEVSRDNINNNSDKLKEAQLAVNTAFDKFKLDESIYMRQKTLWDQNIGSRVEYEQKKLMYESSKNAYESAKSRFAQLKTQYKNELKRAEINVSISSKQQNDFKIKSAIEGEVFDVLREKGDLITPQMPLAIIGKSNQYFIEMSVSEIDIVRIKEGQTVIIAMDSYKGKTFTATIDHIEPIMNERTRNFTVNALFVEAPPVLYPNLSAEASIVIQSKKNCISIPSDYLINGKYVMLANNIKREVVTGLRDYNTVEIISGVNEQDELFKP